eukprot:6973331-Alexandrium_andersonii.AAC.1
MCVLAKKKLAFGALVVLAMLVLVELLAVAPVVFAVVVLAAVTVTVVDAVGEFGGVAGAAFDGIGTGVGGV